MTEQLPSALDLLRRHFLLRILLPCALLIVGMGIFVAIEAQHALRHRNELLAEALARHIEIYLNDAHASLRQVALQEPAHGAATFQAKLQAMKEAMTKFERVLWVGADNKIIFSYPVGFVNIDFPALFPDRDDTLTIVSRPIYSQETEKLTVLMSAETPSHGLLVSELNLDALLRHIANFSVGFRQSLLVVTDAYGNLVSHPNMKLVRQQTNIGDWPILRAAGSTSRITDFYQRDGVWNYETLVKAPTLNWIIVMSTPVWTLFSRTIIAVIVLECILFFFCVALFVAVSRNIQQRIIHPLIAFSQRMPAMLDGHTPPEIKPAQFQELQIIEQEFDTARALILDRECKLRVSEANYRAIFENSLEGIFQSSLDGRFLNVNPALAQILGYGDPKDLIASVHDIGQDLFVDPLQRKHYVARLLRDGFAEEAELRFKRRDGSELWISERARMVRDESGQPLYIEGTIVDVTARKKAESELVQAKQAAEQANSAKSEFLANMSHEIRTPLNGVLGMLQLLEASDLNPEQEDYIRKACQASQRLTQLLSDVLDLSRIEAGKLTLRNAPMDMRALQASVLDIFMPIATQKGLALEYLVDPRIPRELVGDEMRLRQILFNLVGNAVKFCEKGFVRVEASALPHRNQNEFRVLFTVSDSGIGLSDELLAVVFEPFVQAEGSYARKFQGAGLGLSIVRKLVKLMRGELSIDNSESGTTVYLSIPFTPATTAMPQDVSPTVAPTPPTPLRILLAEDDAVNALACRRLLEKCGHTVVTANNGQEALDSLAAEDIDLILMDVQMPIMDGLAATKALRSSKALGPKSRTPVIAITAYAMSGDRERILDSGMDDYLAKPVNMAELTATIARIAAQKNT